MMLRRADYFLAKWAHATAPLGRLLASVEAEYLRQALGATPVVNPVFLTGLARSGTTILLQELCRTGLFATHRYRDFPFLMTPFVWNRFLDRFTEEQAPHPRPHQDRIQITRESPEAFEEPIWQHFFPHVHDANAVHRLTADVSNHSFEQFFRQHIQKILFIRGRQRYLSKGNYNVARLEYIAKIFPSARFVIPVRHPVSHVVSLMRQHRIFMDYFSRDRRVPKYLALAGHYEFGPQRVPIRLADCGPRRAEQAWQNGNEHVGYAIQWADVYGFVQSLRSRQDALSERIAVVRYEDFCADPGGTLRAILLHAGFEESEIASDATYDHIAPPGRNSSEPGEGIDAEIWQETAPVARSFGYATEVQPDVEPPPQDSRQQAASTVAGRA